MNLLDSGKDKLGSVLDSTVKINFYIIYLEKLDSRWNRQFRRNVFGERKKMKVIYIVIKNNFIQLEIFKLFSLNRIVDFCHCNIFKISSGK
jgi:hypothetical protein